jgi:hypothetical protein
MNVRDVPEPVGLDIIDSALWFQTPSTLAGVLDPTWQPAARDVLYSFLHQCSRASIPELCTSLKVPLWGTKLIMEHRVYRALCMRLPPSLIASEVNIAGLPPETVSTESSASITELIAFQRQRGHPKMVPWRRAPDGDTDVPSQLGDERRITVDTALSDRENVDEVRAAATRTILDFERLLGILSEDAEVRTALIDSSLSRSRAQLDAGVREIAVRIGLWQ